jgi:hypothetical protein
VSHGERGGRVVRSPLVWTPRAPIVATALAVLTACHGPRVGPPLEGGGGAGGVVDCDTYCDQAMACGQDCRPACEVSRAICGAEWDAALACGAGKAQCDADWGLPSGAPGCEPEFQAALTCAPHGTCATEDSFELCHGCCAAFEPSGGVEWQDLFRDCVCESCGTECGSQYCGTEAGSPLECESCAAAYCSESVSGSCLASPTCRSYELCVGGCPRDDSSHCSSAPSLAACEDCCVLDFSEGARRYDEVLTSCACVDCADACLDSEICEGFDTTKPACSSCLDATCGPLLVDTCGSEPACSSYMLCLDACSAAR